MKKTFYLAGGMSKFGKEEFDQCNEWRDYIKNKIENSCNGNVQCCNPNNHFNFLDDSTYKSEREIMEYDLYRVRSSNAIIVNFNDSKSIGTACELAVAHEYRIPIIGLCENNEENILHPWLKEFCNRIFTDREELILYLFHHYINED